MNEEKQLTWDDIEKSFQKLGAAMKTEDGTDDPEKFAAFKRKLLNHLDGQLNEPVDTGVINVISKWADIVNEKAMNFHNERGHYPNIMLAGRKTYDRIDKYCKMHPENLSWAGEGEPPEFDGLSCFVAENYRLEFCIDDQLKGNRFRLIFDETPDFDGEEASNHGENKRFGYRKAA